MEVREVHGQRTQLPATLSVTETAAVARISRRHAYKLVKEGVIPSIRLGTTMAGVTSPSEHPSETSTSACRWAGKPAPDHWVHRPRSGEWRELRDPDAPATERQFRRLNRLGMLDLVESAEPITQAEAAAAGPEETRHAA
jgi:excisionase family DNA binding protein